METSGFESFKPKLRSGRIRPQKNFFLYETDEPFDQIILPIELIRLTLFFNGERSVREIVTEVYSSKASVRFKLIYNAIYELRDRGFFENGDELHFAPSKIVKDNKKQYYAIRPIFKMYLARRIFNDQTHPAAFYGLTLLTMSIALVGLAHGQKSLTNAPVDFLSAQPLKSLLGIFLSFSFLLSCKNLFKSLLLLTITGKVYNLKIVFNGLALYFRAGSESARLIGNKLFSTLLFASVSVSPLFFAFALDSLSGGISINDIVWFCALILTFSSIDPFSSNEFSSYFTDIQSDEALLRVEHIFGQNSVMHAIHSNDKIWGSIAKNTFVALASTWVFLGCAAIIFFYTFNGKALMQFIRFGSWYNQLGAFLLLCLPVAGLLMLIINLSWLFSRLLITPFRKLLQSFKRRAWKRSLKSKPIQNLAPVIAELPLFSYFRERELKSILDQSSLMQLKPNTPILHKGEQGDHLFILIEGALDVFADPVSSKDPTTEIHPISIFGEWAVLEQQPRGASVTTKSQSIVLEIPGRILKKIAEERSEIGEMENFVKSIMINQFFTSAPMFRDLPKALILQFTNKGQIESVPKRKIVCKQGEQGKGFFLILRGSVLVTVGTKTLSKIGQGGFFW